MLHYGPMTFHVDNYTHTQDGPHLYHRRIEKTGAAELLHLGHREEGCLLQLTMQTRAKFTEQQKMHVSVLPLLHVKDSTRAIAAGIRCIYVPI